MKNKKVWLLPLAVMAAIWFFSSAGATESSMMSGSLLGLVLDFMKGIFPDLDKARWFAQLHFYIRKLAHMTEFTLLYGSFIFAMTKNRISWAGPKAFALTLAYACLDEFHQTFVPGRYGCVPDVMIDTILPLLITLLGLAVWGPDFEKRPG